MRDDFSPEALAAKLAIEFRDQAHDRLGTLNDTLEAARNATHSDAAALGLELMRPLQGLRGMAGGYGFPHVGMVAGRLEDYLSGLSVVEPRSLADIQTHLDRIHDLIERQAPPAPEELAQLLRALPTRYTFDVNDVVVKNVEVMLVTPTRVVAKLLSGELAACGFRPVVVHDPLDALAQAVRVPPGMVIASVVMEPINGVELLRALRQFRGTRAVPMAVLTSLDGDQKPLHELPDGAAVLHTGAGFADDFGLCAAQFGLG